LTATVNDGCQVGTLIGGLVRIIGMQSGLSDSQLNGIIGNVTTSNAIEEPPVPELIEIEESASSEDEGDNSLPNAVLQNAAPNEENESDCD